MHLAKQLSEYYWQADTPCIYVTVAWELKVCIDSPDLPYVSGFAL